MKNIENLGRIVLSFILLGMASIPWWFVIPTMIKSPEIIGVNLIVFFISWSILPFIGSMVVLSPVIKKIQARRSKSSNMQVDEQIKDANQTDQSNNPKNDNFDQSSKNKFDQSSKNKPGDSLSHGIVLLFMAILPWGFDDGWIYPS